MIINSDAVSISCIPGVRLNSHVDSMVKGVLGQKQCFQHSHISLYLSQACIYEKYYIDLCF